VQAGGFLYSTPTVNDEIAIDIGGHWLITRDRVALNIAVDQVFFQDNTTSSIPDGSTASGSRIVTFSKGRRVQAELLAIPTSGRIQIMVGGGFAIHQITDAAAQGTFTSLAQQSAVARIVGDQDTKAFVVFSGGAQYRLGRLAAFAKYQFMPQAKDFLITSETHALTGGLRYALTSSSEEISTKR
jgi:hypothetical protein